VEVGWAQCVEAEQKQLKKLKYLELTTGVIHKNKSNGPGK